ncbi:MAG: TerB family tellurite resistance protein, partial [Sphingomonadales bacterium]
MSVWGKIIGGVAGFALGGPIGALIGAMTGHAFDRMSEEGAPDGGLGEDMRQTAFTVAVIALGAKMAKADGRVTRDEVETFKKVFRIPPEEAGNVGRFFNQAKQEAHGYEPYARQIANMFRNAPAVLEDLLDALFLIAKADGA